MNLVFLCFSSLTKNYFTYEKLEEPLYLKTHYNYSLNDFTSFQWTNADDAIITQSTLTVKPNKTKDICPRINFAHSNIDQFERVKTFCKGIPAEKAVCYVDIMSSVHFIRWGANAPLGGSNDYELTNPIPPDVDIRYSIYFINENPEQSATFELPQLTYFNQTYHELTPTVEDLGQNTQKMVITIQPSFGKICLSSLLLENPHIYPLPNPNLNAWDPEIGSSPIHSFVPTISNGTHTIGFDIYNFDFLHCWHQRTRSMFGKKYLSFAIFMNPIEEFKISLFFIKQGTESYYDALEKWHLRFPDVYQVQIAGSGRWATFPKLGTCFPDSTEDRDVYGAQFQWGVYYQSDIKTYLPNFIYIEPSIIHIKFPYKADTYITDIKECSLNKSCPDHLNCIIALESASRNYKGKLDISQEQQGWNEDGMIARVAISKTQLNETIKSMRSTLEDLIKQGTHFTGIGFDSFSNSGLDFVTEDHNPGENVIPYNLLVSDGQDYREAVPLLAHYFNFYKPFLNDRYTPKGWLTNSNAIPNQFARFSANTGWELKLTVDGYFKKGAHHNSLWNLRFVLGSRSVAPVENVARPIAYKYKEEYFSYLLGMGIAASYFSEDAYHNNFWANCSDLLSMRSHFEKWQPITKKVLDNTVYFANQDRRVKMTFTNENDQNPPIDVDESIEFFDKTMFCEKENNFNHCYLNLFLGYDKNHTVGNDFRRIYDVSIVGHDIKCIFNSEYAQCEEKPNKDGVIVKMIGVPSSRTYQLSVVEFIKNVPETHQTTTGSTKSNIGLIVGCVIGAVVVVAVVVVTVIVIQSRKKKLGNYKDGAISVTSF